MTHLTYAIVLKKEPFKECDIKYTIYTQLHGKVLVIAKGAKKITSKLNCHLEFFMISNVMIADSLSVKRIAGAQINERFKNIIESIEKRVIALYFLEIIDLLVKYDFEDIIIFEITKSFLTVLDSTKTREDSLLCLNQYLFQLLEHLGYRPEIKSQKQGGLFSQFNKLIMEISEREVKSYGILSKLFS